MKSPDVLPFGIPVVGLIGGVGSGKSSVARGVAARAPVAVIDADRLGHEALREPVVKEALRQRFGSEIFDPQGEVERSRLAERVFGVENASARSDLNAIVHPEIGQRTREQIHAARAGGALAVLLDAAVLLEAGWDQHCDAVVFIDAKPEVRLRRVQARNGWTESELQRREASQLPLDEKRRRSTLTIDNSEDTPQGAFELLDFLCQRWGVCCNPLPNSSQQI